MTYTIEYCGCDSGAPHMWREGPSEDPEVHLCTGTDPLETDVDQQDELYERGAY